MHTKCAETTLQASDPWIDRIRGFKRRVKYSRRDPLLADRSMSVNARIARLDPPLQRISHNSERRHTRHSSRSPEKRRFAIAIVKGSVFWLLDHPAHNTFPISARSVVICCGSPQLQRRARAGISPASLYPSVRTESKSDRGRRVHPFSAYGADKAIRLPAVLSIEISTRSPREPTGQSAGDLYSI